MVSGWTVHAVILYVQQVSVLITYNATIQYKGVTSRPNAPVAHGDLEGHSGVPEELTNVYIIMQSMVATCDIGSLKTNGQNL